MLNIQNSIKVNELLTNSQTTHSTHHYNTDFNAQQIMLMFHGNLLHFISFHNIDISPVMLPNRELLCYLNMIGPTILRVYMSVRGMEWYYYFLLPLLCLQCDFIYFLILYINCFLSNNNDANVHISGNSYNRKKSTLTLYNELVYHWYKINPILIKKIALFYDLKCEILCPFWWGDCNKKQLIFLGFDCI